MDEAIQHLLAGVQQLNHTEMKQLESLLRECGDVISVGDDDKAGIS